MIPTNSPANTDAEKQFWWRDRELERIIRSGSTNATDLLVEGARALIKDYPERENGYQTIMIALEEYERAGNADKAIVLAEELQKSSVPKTFSNLGKRLS